jgi:hypothetical protein
MYGFVPEPVPVIDVEVSNRYTATHPTSSFVTGLFVGRCCTDRCLSLFVFEPAVLVERLVGGVSEVTEVARTEVPDSWPSGSTSASRPGKDGHHDKIGCFPGIGSGLGRCPHIQTATPWGDWIAGLGRG